ncbi:prostaglandin E synthase 2 [Atheta coriaria]|uniref:prostaglandin E synthase 2 n=1 Tax=Dalotia coriaria TaxID=877792 RepID=UPI0031F3E90A
MLTRQLRPAILNAFRAVNLVLRDVSTTGPKTVKKSGVRLGMASLTVGALVGTGYSIHQLNKPRLHILNEQTTIALIDNVPQIAPTKSFKYVGDTSGLKLTLFQYQTCPFCCKVRAFLDYYGISYDVVEVDPVLRQATKWSTYKKVPILLALVDKEKGTYQPLNDSTMIISSLASYLKDQDSSTDNDLHSVVKCYPSMTYQDEDGSVKSEIMNKYFLMFNNKQVRDDVKEKLNEERKWRKWADDVLVHDLSPNVYRTKAEALQAFNWFSEVGEWEKNFPSWERNLIVYVGASAMWLIGKRLKKRHNLKDDVRESLYDHCNQWTRAIKAKGGEFMGGKEPNLADLAVFGVLSSIEGCDAFKDLLQYSNIKGWYFSMKDAVKQHKGAAF